MTSHPVRPLIGREAYTDDVHSVVLDRNTRHIFRVQDISVWAISVTGHFGRDISVHKELMKFVKFVDVNEYLGRIIIYPYNTRQIKTRQFALPKARSNSGAKMIKFSAIETLSKIPSEIRNITCLALFAAKYKKYVLLGY